MKKTCCRSNITIRNLRINDYDSLINLWDSSKLPYKPKGRDSREGIEKMLRLENANLLVAESDGKLIGSAIGTHDGRKGWINRTAIHPDYQKHGIAKILVERLEKWLMNEGMLIIASLVENHNKLNEILQKNGICSIQ